MYDWGTMIYELQQAKADCMFLMSHASYLFKTGGKIWAVDLRLDEDMHLQADSTIKWDLQQLRYAILTHLHPDHYDPALIEKLSGIDCTWIAPDFMSDGQKAHLLRCFPKCIFVKAGDQISIDDMQIQVFASPHSDTYEGKIYSVPEYGYAVVLPGHRMLFPGDVRQYETGADVDLPDAELFAHIWLGRKAALNYSPHMVDLFCDYYLSMKPRRVFLGHLYDLHRSSESMWTEEHALVVKKRMQDMDPTVPVLIPRQGQKILL